MDPRTVLTHVDHTLLKPDATRPDIQKLCEEAMEYHCASICINPCYIPYAREVLQGRVPICTVIGFPLGAMTTDAKIYEAQNAIALGADEVDMVINIGALREKRYDYVEDEIRAIKKAVGNHVLKVIVETCLLTDEEKAIMCKIVADAGADYIKTSTGFSTGGATAHDVEIFARETNGRIKIKAAGGIRSYADMEHFLALGADRLGCSSGVRLVKEKLGL
jgi:deoxyribose-phosphate aldolase